MFYSCLSEILNNSKNKLLQWKTYATRAFYPNASDSVESHNLSSLGPRQVLSKSDPGDMLLECLCSTQAISCKTYCELHSRVPVVMCQLFLCQMGFGFGFGFITPLYENHNSMSLSNSRNSISHKYHRQF